MAKRVPLFILCSTPAQQKKLVNGVTLDPQRKSGEIVSFRQLVRAQGAKIGAIPILSTLFYPRHEQKHHHIECRNWLYGIG